MSATGGLAAILAVDVVGNSRLTGRCGSIARRRVL